MGTDATPSPEEIESVGRKLEEWAKTLPESERDLVLYVVAQAADSEVMAFQFGSLLGGINFGGFSAAKSAMRISMRGGAPKLGDDCQDCGDCGDCSDNMKGPGKMRGGS